MNAVILKNNINIENLIYEVRGVQVMLDSDLARLYECTNGTKDINKAVKRNLERFPENFMFRLTDEEYNALRFQIGTSNIKGGRRYNPYVFTEQGVAMLSSVLHSETAINMSIKIINAFVMMRKYVSTNILEQKYINNMVLEDHDKIRALEDSFQKFEEKRKTTEIYFNGQIYDAYSKIQEIFNSAKNELIIIDGYADNTMLDIVKRLKIKVTIITKPNNLLTLQDIEKYNKQYNNLTVIYDNTFHDRYFIIDEKIVYHCGASINRIGYKTFSITLIGDSDVKEALLKKVNKRQEEKNMNFIIKEGNINDINEVVDAIKYLHDIIENKEWYAIGLADYDKILDKLNDDAIIVKALYKDDLAGFLLAERHINPNGELAEEIPKDELSSSIEMDNAGVLPKYRGNHLQEHLILKVESIMQERDSSIKYSYATVHPDNLPSLKTLEKAGYKKYKEKLMYGGKIRYIMIKELI